MWHSITQNKALTVFVLIFLPVTLVLGFWQLDRSAQKETLVSAAQEGKVLRQIDAQADLLGLPDYQQVTFSSIFTEPYIWLLDNQVWQSQVGVDVVGLVPVGSRHLLVNRGWLSWTDRSELPVVALPTGTTKLLGTLSPIAGETFVLAPDSPQENYPQLRQSIVLNDIETQTGYALWPYILYLQDGSEALLEPHWRMVQMGPEKHLGYAVQWFGLALTLVILYLYRIRQHSKTRHHKDLDK